MSVCEIIMLCQHSPLPIGHCVLDRSAREWPQDKALIREIYSRCGICDHRHWWITCHCQQHIGMVICGLPDSQIVQTSSTRMELEAIRNALLWLKETPSNCSFIIIFTDSMAVLIRIGNGWLPDGWHMDDSDCICSSMTNEYFTGYAGPVINETVNSLASYYKAPSPSQALLCRQQSRSQNEHTGEDNWQTKRRINALCLKSVFTSPK